MDGLHFLYHTAPGRALLHPLGSRALSKVCGAFLDCRLSKPLIKGFVKKAEIDPEEYIMDGFTCFNDCFCRRVKEGLRPAGTADWQNGMRTDSVWYTGFVSIIIIAMDMWRADGSP